MGVAVIFILARQKGVEPFNLGQGSGVGESLKPLDANLQTRRAKKSWLPVCLWPIIAVVVTGDDDFDDDDDDDDDDDVDVTITTVIIATTVIITISVIITYCM